MESMRLSCTIFEILSLIFQNLKRSHDKDHAHFRDSLSPVGCDLLCSTHIPSLNLSTITCNEKMKRNAKCKNSRFDHPFGNLAVTHRVRVWLDGKRIVDFILVIIEFFSLAFSDAALLSEICRNRLFLKGWVTLSTNFRWMGMSPAIRLWTIR